MINGQSSDLATCKESLLKTLYAGLFLFSQIAFPRPTSFSYDARLEIKTTDYVGRTKGVSSLVSFS